MSDPIELGHLRYASRCWGRLLQWLRSGLSDSTLKLDPELMFQKAKGPNAEAGILDRFWLEFFRGDFLAGGAESDEGIEVFGRPEGAEEALR
jgi:hypothetical protein